mgnify:CR=1 FL=1
MKIFEITGYILNSRNHKRYEIRQDPSFLLSFLLQKYKVSLKFVQWFSNNRPKISCICDDGSFWRVAVENKILTSIKA